MTQILIVGAGRGGTALLEMFRGDPTVRVVGIADTRVTSGTEVITLP